MRRSLEILCVISLLGGAPACGSVSGLSPGDEQTEDAPEPDFVNARSADTDDLDAIGAPPDESDAEADPAHDTPSEADDSGPPVGGGDGDEEAEDDAEGAPGREDSDEDGLSDDIDNCPEVINPAQGDLDQDGLGDDCDPDRDGDGVDDQDDNCADDMNPDQADGDQDDVGDACDPDADGDDANDDEDNCPGLSNPGQADEDGDAIGDACEPDTDDDDTVDDDDNCPLQPNSDQADADDDGIGDACEPDIDSDGAPDDWDNCPAQPNSDQADADGDGIGDTCEPDGDDDGVPDDDDNCPDIPNNNQADADNDGLGDACEPDFDEDGIPDDGDLFPFDGALPGAADTNFIYPHTSSTLYSLDAGTLSLTQIGSFGWPDDGGNHQMTDLALDSYGTIFGVSYSHLYTCHPETAACTSLGALPGSYNGLTMLPPGSLDPDVDVLIAISTTGLWYRLDVTAGLVNATLLGLYGPGYTSSGDAYAIAGVGTFAAVNASGSAADLLVALVPETGAVDYEVGPIGSYSNIWGLAGWLGRAYAFASSGDVLQIDLATGVVSTALETNHSWWGAGVATQIP